MWNKIKYWYLYRKAKKAINEMPLKDLADAMTDIINTLGEIYKALIEPIKPLIEAYEILQTAKKETGDKTND